MKRILVATDGSTGGDRAVDAAATLASKLAAELIIVTVQDGIPADAAEAFETVEHVAPGDVAEVAAQGLLFRARERATKAGIVQLHVQSEVGDPTEAILKAAAARRADVIVVGRRGRGRLAGLLLGSVSQKLASLAPCPVIVVP
jgi:nucleotide-binding universal stress UspA family protein